MPLEPTWESCICSKNSCHNNLILRLGHLAASYTFADLPVFENYVSFAMNPTPVSLVSNDLSYTGPPPGLEWGIQALYNITPVVQVAEASSTPIRTPLPMETSSPFSKATRACW